MAKLLILTFFSLAATAWGYSRGAPETVCDDMTPKHPGQPKTTRFPYTVLVSSNEAKAEDVLKITVTGKPFKGFLVEVRGEDDKAAGTFLIPDDDKYLKTINCHNNNASAATHKSAHMKDDVILPWKVPSTPGKYTVYVTVAEEAKIYWVRKPTEVIKVE